MQLNRKYYHHNQKKKKKQNLLIHDFSPMQNKEINLKVITRSNLVALLQIQNFVVINNLIVCQIILKIKYI